MNTYEDKNRISKILLVFYWVLLLASIAVICKIAYIQFIWEPDAQTLENFVPSNRKVEIKPERGDILDCNGRLLASSTPLYTIRLDCQIQKRELENGAILSIFFSSSKENPPNTAPRERIRFFPFTL